MIRLLIIIGIVLILGDTPILGIGIIVIALHLPEEEVQHCETYVDIPEELIPLLKDEEMVDLTGRVSGDTLYIEFLTDQDI